MTGGHGHVVPREDGGRARCGGPRLCKKCAAELAGIEAVAPELIARAFHEAYERLAPEHGHQRPGSAVPWEETPELNRTLMVAVVAELLAARTIARGPGLSGEQPATEPPSVGSGASPGAGIVINTMHQRPLDDGSAAWWFAQYGGAAGHRR
ncbi:hypothetical protein ACGFJC_47015 [Nonomuraea fuscirosea]|uniref:hypothetical protein n=1 Tax=Nonomuraea fuscirosea TaxID=1291556 RepID=UPI00371E4F86